MHEADAGDHRHRIDGPDGGGAWSEYLAATRRDTAAFARELLDVEVAPAGEVTLTDWSPRAELDAEVTLAAGALYPHVALPETQLEELVRSWTPEHRRAVLAAYVGERANRRHRPGRAFERVWYRFDVLGDYGGFRDLQRHRMLTVEWQALSPRHGYETPPELVDAGVDDAWHDALERSASLYDRLVDEFPVQAQYAVCFAYRVRYVMQLNARAAMQMLELRSTPQGHPTYRRIVQEMHRQIADVAGHHSVAEAMRHVDHSANELERLESERAAESRRRSRDSNEES
ncbi:MAG: FAD-dependent thymidylate synthase [Nitriliruptoraceae bacterium]